MTTLLGGGATAPTDTPAAPHRPAFVDDPASYRLLVLRRVRLGGDLVAPGATVTTPELKLAMRLVGCGFAMAVDRHSRLDVALGLALQRAIARPASAISSRP